MATGLIYKNKLKSGGVFLNILLVLSILLAGIMTLQQKTVCEKPLEYSLGKIDKKFNITNDKFLDLVTDAENIWEKGMGMELFTYNPDAEFKINLIFDERQQNTIAEKRLRESLDEKNDSYNKLVKEYDTLKALHDKQFEQYSNNVALYEERLKKYNEKVAYWNDLGGAPKKEFKKLEQERLYLENTASELNKKVNDLNVLNKKVNAVASKINNFANKLNSDVNTYNKTFGKAKIFDQGEYTGDRINIYQFDGTKDLRVVLAHEFGHALNLDHVQNPKSIMYYLMDEQNMESPALSKEDIEALNTECKIN